MEDVLIALPVQFLLFKMLYPYPNFRGDSAAYIDSAMVGANATEWPVGYSKFLAIVHFFSHSDTVLVSIHYLLLETSARLFIIALQYFIAFNKMLFNLFLP